MDIHLPKPFHNWREFLKEYGIIVLGVLTALGLEQAIEWVHHRAQVREATERLRAESLENREFIAFGIANLRAGVKQADSLLAELGNCDSAIAADRLAPVERVLFLVPSEAAWLGMRDSALLPLMPSVLADNYWKIDTFNAVLAGRRDDLFRARDEAAASVNVLRSGVRDRHACSNAIFYLQRLREEEETLRGQAEAFRLSNEEVLNGERIGVSTARKNRQTVEYDAASEN